MKPAVATGHSGWLVYERYFHNYTMADAHQIMSVIKSFYAILVGIALRLGLIPSLDTPLPNFCPNIPNFNANPCSNTSLSVMC